MHPELVQAAALLNLNTSESFDEAVRLLRKVVYSFSMRICRHREDAEDTTQEVMFRSLRHLRRFQDPKRLALWLYVVTRNRYRRMCRKRPPHIGYAVSIDELQVSEAFTTSCINRDQNSPETALARVEEHRLLLQAIQRVPAPLRSVLVLHDLRQVPTSEIASILALKQGTIRVRLHRARSRAREEMGTMITQKVGEA